MKRLLRIFTIVVLTAIFGIANAQNSQWYGFARTSMNGESWQSKFITFNTQNPGEVQAVSETFPEIFAATYHDGYVWFVTTTRDLCKAPFDEETQTIGAYETVISAFEQYNLVVDMAYNQVDGMMYYLCQDSQYNCYLKRSDINTLSSIETIGIFNNLRMWTLAIDLEGHAYGVAYEGGNLYKINLADASTTLVGPTGKEVWYTQSMAFDLETGELYWAQFATSSDHGFYQVNTETGAATSLGVIGSGTQLTGLFMVYDPAPQPGIIDEIYVEGFTEPAWGEHADFVLEVPADAHYSINNVIWWWHNAYDTGTVGNETFDREDVAYFMSVELSAEEGYSFAEDVTVYFNGDATVFNAANSYSLGSLFMATTIDFYVTDDGVAEQTAGNIAVWPNPVKNVLYLNGVDGALVQIYDATGRMVLQQIYEGQLEVSNLAQGMYVIKAAGCVVRFVRE